MIIGIAGTNGAGKGTVVDYLVGKNGFEHYSCSAFIVEEIERRGLVVNRDSMIAVGNDLRNEHGPAYIVEALYKRAHESKAQAIIESLRTVAEAKKIKELGGFIIGVDADMPLRFERSKLRGSVKDNVTYDKWLEQETIESHSNDPTKQNIFDTLKQSDAVILNNGTLAELHAQVDAALNKIATR